MRYKRCKYDQTIKIALYYWTSTQKNIPVDDRMKEVQIVFNRWFKSITKKKSKNKFILRHGMSKGRFCYALCTAQEKHL